MIPYVQFSVALHSCIDDPEDFAIWLKEQLMKSLDPEMESDIDIEITESAG